MVTEGEGRVDADRDKCIGAGQCVLFAPDLFDQDDEEGLVVVRAHDVPSSMMIAARQAVDSCPARAIELRE